MARSSSSETVRSRAWQLAVLATSAAIAYAFWPALKQLFQLWTSQADYSHGLLFLPYAGYILWTRREMIPTSFRWPELWGLPFFALAGAVFLIAERTNIAKEWLQGFAVLLAVVGGLVMFFGRWAGLNWAWPALVVFPLVLELPWSVYARLSFKLRELATTVGNATFLTAGFPSYSEGNVIVIGSTRLGVEEACSGLSMLLTFVAVAVVAAILMRSRPLSDRLLIVVSAVPIAVLCNIIRIVFTGLVYHAGWKDLGDLIVHDLFGWLMMPLALAMIALELRIIDWLFVPVVKVSQDDLLKFLRPGRVS